jgi:hypothetical protein
MDATEENGLIVARGDRTVAVSSSLRIASLCRHAK